MEKYYRKPFGRGSLLTASYENGTYRWRLIIGHQDVGEVILPNIPNADYVVIYLLQQRTAKLIGTTQGDLRLLKGVVKDSIKYLQNIKADEKISKK